jgi:hypothetical protein
VTLNTISLTLQPIPFSNSWRTQYILEQWVFFEINLNHRRIFKLNYVESIYLPTSLSTFLSEL